MSIGTSRRKSWAQHKWTLLASLAATAIASPAVAGNHYGITITTASTRNVKFVNGVFKPTAEKATLNVGDLETALAAGNVEVTTGNDAGGSQKGDLHVEVADVSWTSGYALTLDAFHSIFVDEPITDGGTGALTLTTNDGGSGGIFVYGTGGHITLANVSNVLTIDGQPYTLVSSIKSLADGIAANPSGNYALANNVEGGRHKGSPITTALTGTVNGLGNTISKLLIDDSTNLDSIGFFAEIGQTGVVQDLRLGISINIAEPQLLGGLAATNLGQLIDDSVQSHLRTMTANRAGSIGGLVGVNSGAITRCNVSTDSRVRNQSSLGGLVGSDSGGVIAESFAAGTLSANDNSSIGGLVGTTSRTSIVNSYATASTRSAYVYAGGLVGVNGDTQGNAGLIATSYSTGTVAGPKRKPMPVGGLIGIDYSPSGSIANSYWDTTTSGVTNLSQGAWSPANDPGITGESSVQLMSVLPTGFDPSVWAESPSINNGLPYLIANPPPE